MKTVKQILEQYDVLTNKVTNENKRLVALVCEGLLEEEKLPLIERCLSMDPELTTIAERTAVNEFLESLMTMILLEKKEENPFDKLSRKLTNLGKNDDDPNHPTNRQAPALLMFQRKAIRVYPDNMKVVVYYSPFLDKYISIPFGGKSLSVVTNVNEATDLYRKVSLSQKRGQSPTEKPQPDNSWQKQSDDAEDAYVRKNSKPNHADTNVSANSQLRGQERAADAKRRIISRATNARSASKFKAGSGALRNAIRNNMDRASEFGHTGRLIAGVGTLAAGTAMRAINRVRGRLEEEALQEAKSSYKSIFKMSIPKRKAAKKSPSLSDMFKKRPPQSKAPKAKTQKATTKEEPKKSETKAAPVKKENVSDLIAKYRKASKDHSNSTGTKYSAFDSDKSKHVEKDMKAELGNYKDRLAQKIKSSGGSVPDVPEQERVKRDPNRKPPPAMAEDWRDYLPGQSSAELERKIREGKGKSFKDNLKNDLEDFAVKGAKKSILPGAMIAAPAAAAAAKAAAARLAASRAAAAAATAGTGAAAGATAAVVASKTTNNNSNNPVNDKTPQLNDQGSDRKAMDNAAARSDDIRSKNKVVRWRDSRTNQMADRRAGGVPFQESHLNTIRKFINEGSNSLDLVIGEHTISINRRIGKKLLTVYESLNSDNKRKVEDMLNEDVSSFKKVINFVVRN